MSNRYEPTQEQRDGWEAWVNERPPAVKAVAERFQPWKLYRLGSTGHRVYIYSIGEGDEITLTVVVSGEYNFVTFERRVFGIYPDELVECELPGKDEIVGSLDMDPHEAMELNP